MDDFRLADWTVHPSLGRITRGDEAVHLQPRVMDVLVYLARQPGKVLSKEEILDAVWPDEFVANSVLTRAVAVLRRALGENAKSPSYIETIPKRGYRLIADVEEVAPSPSFPSELYGTDWIESSPDNLSGSHLLGANVRWYLQWGDREVLLQSGEFIIGRGQEADVAIRERGVSRAHARFTSPTARRHSRIWAASTVRKSGGGGSPVPCSSKMAT